MQWSIILYHTRIIRNDEKDVFMCEIMIVEDNNTIRMMYVAGLQGLGYEVLEAANLKQAREHLDAGHIPKVVLLDLRLPGENGEHLITYIREELANPDVKIIVASAMTSAEKLVEDLGADLFITKPIDLPKLLHRIDKFCSE